MPLDYFGEPPNEEWIRSSSARTNEHRNDIVKEINITQHSRPFFEVYIKGRRPTKKVLEFFYNENIDFQNKIYPDRRYQGAYFCKYGRDLTGIEFEAGAVGARRGTININDPLGVWPEIIGHVSDFSNGLGRGQPNMLIKFGWENLGTTSVFEDKVKEYYSIITETNFELDENGLMKLTINFQEGSINRLRTLKFLSLKDMYMTDPSTNDELENNETKTIDELLDYILKNTSIGKQLARNKTILQFEECSDDPRDKLNMKDYSVRFGDSFYDLMNKLISKATPPEDTEDKDWAYKMKTDRLERANGNMTFFSGTEYEFEVNEGDIVHLIRYEWVSTDKTENDNGADSAGTSLSVSHNAQYLGNIVLKNSFRGEEGSGDVDMTTGFAPYDKTALSFNLDMKPFGALYGVLNSQLQDTLKEFDTGDWNTLKEDVESFIEGERSEDMSDFEATRNTSWVPFVGESEEKFEERKKLYDEIKNFSIESNTGEEGFKPNNPVASKLRTWTKQFPLQATVEILGDPVLGSEIEIGSGYFKMFFNTPSYFTDYLNGMEWLITGVKHKIDNDGLFKTELSLTANVDKQEESDEEEETNVILDSRTAFNLQGEGEAETSTSPGV